MTRLPWIGDPKPGIYQTITNTTDTDPIEVPDTAQGCVLYFEVGGVVVEGRIGLSLDSTPMEDIGDDDLGWFPPIPIEQGTAHIYSWNTVSGVKTLQKQPLYIHVACETAGAIAKGYWLFGRGA